MSSQIFDQKTNIHA